MPGRWRTWRTFPIQEAKSHRLHIVTTMVLFVPFVTFDFIFSSFRSPSLPVARSSFHFSISQQPCWTSCLPVGITIESSTIVWDLKTACRPDSTPSIIRDWEAFPLYRHYSLSIYHSLHIFIKFFFNSRFRWHLIPNVAHRHKTRPPVLTANVSNSLAANDQMLSSRYGWK